MPGLINQFSSSERAARLSLSANKIDFGISFLDDALLGILPNEFIVLGAGTGAGKTQIATQIALHNAIKGVKVKFYALEASQFEIQSRIKYEYLANAFFKDRDKYPEKLNLSFRRWQMGLLDSDLRDLEDSVSGKLEVILGDTLDVFTPNASDFTRKDFAQRYIEDCEAGFGCVILDHLHYLWHADGETENAAIKYSVAAIRDLITEKGVPVIMLSHLRKPDKFTKSFVPTYHELHGSSEISKRANAVITFAGVRELPDPPNDTPIVLPAGSTLFRVAKARASEPGVQQFAGLMRFNLRTNSYFPTYKPYAVDLWAQSIWPQPVESFPSWMRSGREDMP